MIVLGIDTSTEYLSVALINEKKVLVSYNTVGKLNHSALLVPTIQKALRKAAKKFKNIDLFAVGIGPGSFTGLRVGVTAVRALAIALNKPIIGIPTMDAIAYNVLNSKNRDRYYFSSIITLKNSICPYFLCPILDAKKNQVYACIYRITGDKIIKESGYLLEPVDMLLKRLTGEILFLGDGVPLYRQQILSKKSIRPEFIEDKKWFPKASVIAGMALDKFREGKRSDNPYDLEPLYLYARDCNVRRG